MERFFLHIRADGLRDEDTDGFDYVDLDTAKREAVATLRGIAIDRAKIGRPFIDICMEVVDARGELRAVVSATTDALAH